MKRLFPAAQALLALAFVVGSACLAYANSSDGEFFSALKAVRASFFRDVQLVKEQNQFRLATQERGPNDPLLLEQKSLIDLVKKVRPSVVFLGIDSPAKIEGFENPIEKESQQSSFCTGFFIDSSSYFKKPGLIATAAHCVDQLPVGAKIAVGLYDHDDNHPKMMGGIVLACGDQHGKDIAFIELMNTSLSRPPLPLWNKIEVGEQVIAIGNPIGLTFSVSRGIVSALDRYMMGVDFQQSGVNQSDIAINPGGSGGPLVNMWGSVVGLNTTIGRGVQGLAFSEPAGTIIKALKQYARTGNLKIGTLRIHLIVPEGNRVLGIEDVVAGGPGARAGLESGDVILGVDDLSFGGLTGAEAWKAFVDHLNYLSPGENTTLSIFRESRRLHIKATLGSL